MSEVGTGYSPCFTQQAESIEVSASLAVNIVEILISILMLAWLARTASTQKSTVLISVDTFALTDGHQCLSTMSCVCVTQTVHHSLPRLYFVWPGTALYDFRHCGMLVFGAALVYTKDLLFLGSICFMCMTYSTSSVAYLAMHAFNIELGNIEFTFLEGT